MLAQTVTNFVKSKTFMATLFIFVTVIALTGIIYAIATHSEPGFMTVTPGWTRSDFPLQVCSKAHVPSNTEDAASVVANALATTNSRLGFVALEKSSPGSTGERCDIDITIGMPSEAGFTEPGGNARIGKRHVRIETANVRGEVLDLVLQHELGHALQLSHDFYEQSIMREVQTTTPAGEFPPRISDYDRDLLQDIFGPGPTE